MEKHFYETINETIFKDVLNNGMQVLMVPKPDFNKIYALFVTDFGSFDNHFIPVSQKDYVKVNDGIAHFLEHKLFEQEKYNVMEEFAKLGSSANAFTSYTKTAYLFSTTDKVDENIELLLNYVQSLYLTSESVEKEKGIINQEISMVEDRPEYAVYMQAIRNLYHKHPIKLGVIGTVESVNAITKEELELCYNTFYHPSNMRLYIVGNIEPEKLITTIQNNQNSKTFISDSKKDFKKIVEEPKTIVKNYEEIYKDVAVCKIIIATKINDEIKTIDDKLKIDFCFGILLDLLFAKSSDLYENWQKLNIVNDRFYASMLQEREINGFFLSNETNNYQQFIDEVKRLYENIEQIEIKEKDFIRMKNQAMGSLVGLFDRIESIANFLMRYDLEGIDAFSLVDYLDKITFNDLLDAKKYFDWNLTTISLMKPKDV